MTAAIIGKGVNDMLDIDTAIKHCLDVAEQNETQAEKWYKEGGAEWGKTINCRECAADHRQLAEWLRELKDLREEYAYISKVSYGYYKELKEAKRLLKLAVDDISTMPCNNDTHSPDSCYICVKHGNCSYADSFKWCKADEALKLIGEDENET